MDETLPPAVPPFFMYTAMALDHSWLHACAGFRELRLSSRNDNCAEVGLRQALHQHPARVREPARARLFYVPVFEFASYSLGDCNGTTHASRMVAAYHALRASPDWQRHQGADHFFATSAFSNGLSWLAQRIRPLDLALSRATVGRYKPGGGIPYASRVGACVIAIPFATNPHAAHWYRPPGESRPLLAHFAGALDVCCTGAAIRCAFGSLAVAAHAMDDVSIRPMVPANSSLWGACTRRTMAQLLKRQAPATAWGLASAQWSSGDSVAGASWRLANSSLVALTFEQMGSSKFCFMPAGDNGIRSLMYTSVAVGCLIVIVCDRCVPALVISLRAMPDSSLTLA